jgi:hypothetical protein
MARDAGGEGQGGMRAGARVEMQGGGAVQVYFTRAGEKGGNHRSMSDSSTVPTVHHGGWGCDRHCQDWEWKDPRICAPDVVPHTRPAPVCAKRQDRGYICRNPDYGCVHENLPLLRLHLYPVYGLDADPGITHLSQGDG